MKNKRVQVKSGSVGKFCKGPGLKRLLFWSIFPARGSFKRGCSFMNKCQNIKINGFLVQDSSYQNYTTINFFKKVFFCSCLSYAEFAVTVVVWSFFEALFPPADELKAMFPPLCLKKVQKYHPFVS